MSKRVVYIALAICLIFCQIIIGKVKAQDCEEACPPVCESGACPENIVAHLGKYSMKTQDETKTPTNTPTITATAKPTLTPTITTIPGLIVYLNTTPEQPAAPVPGATQTPQPTKAQETMTPEATAILTGTESAVLMATQSAFAAQDKNPANTPTPQAVKNIFGIGRNTYHQWTLLVREWVKNPVWVTVIAILLAILLLILLVRLIGWLVYEIIIWSRAARGVIGPIQVEENKDKPGLASQFYKYLAECGASCQNPALTASPSATPGFTSITAVLKDVAPVESNIISLIVAIFYFLIGISFYKKLGYSITTHIIEADENKNIKLQTIITLIKGQKFKDSRIFSGTSTEEVVKEAAYWVFWYVSGRRKSRAFLAPWLAFPTFESFYNYKKAVCEKVLEKANELFEEASKEAPFNALINLSWGDKNELNNRYIEALKIYLEGIMMWPHLIPFWYRFAVVLDCYPKWIPQFSEYTSNIEIAETKKAIEQNVSKLIAGELNKVSTKYRKKIKPKNENKNAEFYKFIENYDFGNDEFVLYFANIVWFFIRRKISCSFFLWIGQVCINIFARWKTDNYSPAKARYYWSLIPGLFHRAARQTRKAVLIAHYCTIVEQYKNIQLKKLLINTTEESKNVCIHPVESIFNLDKKVILLSNSCWNNMGVYYNVACYFALRSEILFYKYSKKFEELFMDHLPNNYEEFYIKYPVTSLKDSKYFQTITNIQKNELCLQTYCGWLYKRAIKILPKLVKNLAEKPETKDWITGEITNLSKSTNQNKDDGLMTFIRLILNESVKHYFISEAMKYLKISFKEHQPNLTLDWVRNDPDLDPLWGEIEFQALFDISPKKTHKDFKKKDCEKKIAGLKVADAICTVIAKKKTYSYSSITPEFLMTVSKSEIDLWDNLSAFLKEPEKEQLMIKFHDLANQLYDIKLGDPILSIPPKCEIPGDDSIEKEPENEIDYFLILEKINQNCDQLSTHAHDHAEDWMSKLKTSSLFIAQEREPNLIDVWKIWDRARAWQWFSLEKEISKFINSIKLEEKDEMESLAEAYNNLNLISD